MKKILKNKFVLASTILCLALLLPFHFGAGTGRMIPPAGASQAECRVIYWQYESGYVQYAELEQPVRNIHNAEWGQKDFLQPSNRGATADTVFEVVYRDGTVQTFQLRMPSTKIRKIGFPCTSEGLARVKVTDCATGEPLYNVLVSDISRTVFNGHPTEETGLVVISSRPKTCQVWLEKDGYVTKKETMRFSGERMDQYEFCLQKEGTAQQYLGCYKDQGNRDLNGFSMNEPGMTTERCLGVCRDKGFAYAGTQFSTWCFCGNSYGKSGTANNCNMGCGGNGQQTCGGSWANSVYSVNGGPHQPPPPPPPPPPAGPTYLGCYKDQGNRDLNGFSMNEPGMTTERCLSVCRGKGFAYAGTQFSTWCFCGNSYGKSGRANNCNMGCGGNGQQTCGGSWANSVYSVNGGR